MPTDLHLVTPKAEPEVRIQGSLFGRQTQHCKGVGKWNIGGEKIRKGVLVAGSYL